MMTAINNTIAALRARVERFTALIKELEAFREGESGCNMPDQPTMPVAPKRTSTVHGARLSKPASRNGGNGNRKPVPAPGSTDGVLWGIVKSMPDPMKLRAIRKASGFSKSLVSCWANRQKRDGKLWSAGYGYWSKTKPLLVAEGAVTVVQKWTPKPDAVKIQAAVRSTEDLLDAPSTLGAAMKRAVLKFEKPFTCDELMQAVVANGHSALIDKVKPDTAVHNLAYWASKQYVEKLGTGHLATFRVLNRSFFKHLVESVD
jgi:hypothetical protein